MKRFITSFFAALLATQICLPQATLADSNQKPLWTKGKYYGGYPSNDKFLEQGITFEIAPDKVTMKEISIEFPAECYDENGVPSPRSIHFSAAEIEPLTLRRVAGSQSLYFAYLDAFGLNWNTELKMKWNREKQSFKIQISSLTDTVENTYCKADATLSKGAVKGRSR